MTSNVLGRAITIWLKNSFWTQMRLPYFPRMVHTRKPLPLGKWQYWFELLCFYVYRNIIFLECYVFVNLVSMSCGLVGIYLNPISVWSLNALKLPQNSPLVTWAVPLLSFLLATYYQFQHFLLRKWRYLLIIWKNLKFSGSLIWTREGNTFKIAVCV